MKKPKLLIGVLSVLAALTLAACGESDASEKGAEGDVIVLKAGSNLPTSHITMVNVMQPFIERVEEESDGRVKFEVYDSETLVRAGEELEALRSGTIDIAIPMYDVYDLPRFPFAEIPLLPTKTSSLAINAEAISLLHSNEEPYSDGKTHTERLYTDQNLVAWPLAPGNSYTIATVGDPIETVKDIQSMQLRVPSNSQEIFTKNLGASPVNISINETFDAFSRGTLDGGYTTVADWKSYGFDEVFKYALDDLNIGVWPTVIAMDKDRFESLPTDIQEIISNAAREIPNPKHNPEVEKAMLEIEDEIRKDFAANGGVFESVNDLSPEVQNLFEEAIVDTWMEWIDMQEANGQPGREAAIRWKDAILEAGGDLPEELKNLSMD